MRIPIVDENDELIGYKEKKERDPKEITRVSALWVTDKDGNILLAQRVFTKKNDPGKWGPAVAGTVEEGETYEQNMIKEAYEEIGLKDFTYTIGPKNRRSTSHEYFGQWFVAVVDHGYPFIKQDEEVEAIRWFSPSELAILFKEKPEMFLSGFDRYFTQFQ
jgi:isopentenyldiphosphate isomerase